MDTKEQKIHDLFVKTSVIQKLIADHEQTLAGYKEELQALAQSDVLFEVVCLDDAVNNSNLSRSLILGNVYHVVEVDIDPDNGPGPYYILKEIPGRIWWHHKRFRKLEPSITKDFVN